MALLTHVPGDCASRHPEADEAEWLNAFHRGDRGAIASCYRDHFDGVERAIGEILRGPDRETVIHEVFSRLIGQEDLRRSFRGGSMGAWLAAVARNAAIDYRRRLAREKTLVVAAADVGPDATRWEDAAQAHLLIEQFRRQSLGRVEWAKVFDLCFLQQMSQRDAARALGLSRTTLAYRTMRIGRALRRFLLEGDP